MFQICLRFEHSNFFRVSSFEFPAATAVRICFEFCASNFVLAHVSAIRISRPYGLAFGRTGST
jgi:hypothetical protein